MSEFLDIVLDISRFTGFCVICWTGFKLTAADENVVGKLFIRFFCDDRLVTGAGYGVLCSLLLVLQTAVSAGHCSNSRPHV